MSASPKRPMFTGQQAYILVRSPHLLPVRRLGAGSWLCADLGSPAVGDVGTVDLGPYVLTAAGDVLDVDRWLRALPEVTGARSGGALPSRTYRALQALENIRFVAVPAQPTT